jgi:hypothetical protein
VEDWEKKGNRQISTHLYIFCVEQQKIALLQTKRGVRERIAKDFGRVEGKSREKRTTWRKMPPNFCEGIHSLCT